MPPRISFCIGHGFSFDPQSAGVAGGAAAAGFGFAGAIAAALGAYEEDAGGVEDATPVGGVSGAGATLVAGAGLRGSGMRFFGTAGSGCVSGSGVATVVG